MKSVVMKSLLLLLAFCFTQLEAANLKVSKKSYQWVFWLIVLSHQLLALDCMFGGLFYNGLRSLGELSSLS